MIHSVLTFLGIAAAAGVVLWAFAYNYQRTKMQHRANALAALLEKDFPNFDEIIILLTKFRTVAGLQLFLQIYNEGLTPVIDPIANLEHDIIFKFSNTEWNRILYLWSKKGIVTINK